MKKLLLLGGSRYLLPAIKAAHELGAYVITADYLPNNLAHPFADEYHNISIIDKEAVVNLAKELQVDGILSFATDPGVAIAAYACEKLGLPGSPYESVAILQNKGKFRNFLKENGFNVPFAKSYSDPEEAQKDVDLFQWPVIVKPTDSAGSKGVSRVDNPQDLKASIEYALSLSLGKEFIVEEFIEKAGCSTDTDSFSVDGELVFFSLNNQWFDESAENPYTPAAYSWPSSMPQWAQEELRSEIQRMLKLLNMKTSIYNIETRLGKNGKTYIMECSPRAGGNRLSELLRMATGQDLIKANVRSALGLPLEQKLTDPVYNGYWGEVILHSNQAGVFTGIEIDDEIKPYVEELDLWVKEGDEIHEFTGANETIGMLIFRCETAEKLNQILQCANAHVHIKVR